MTTPRRQSPPRFDPCSLNATLATIIAETRAAKVAICVRLDQQDVKLASIEEQAIKTNGRVGLLELWRETSKARLAGMAAVCGAFGSVIVWLAGILLG